MQAEQHWRRLVAIRQRRRKGTPGAAAAVNNLGVLLVEQSGPYSVEAEEGRMLLKVKRCRSLTDRQMEAGRD